MTLDSPCPVAFTTRVMGGKWKARIVWALVREGRLRFSGLRRACPPISDRILSKELRELDEWGLVARHEQPGDTPLVEYALTDLGQTLRPVMAAMADWGVANRAAVTGGRSAT